MYISRGGILGVAVAEALPRSKKGASGRPESGEQGSSSCPAKQPSPAPVPLTNQNSRASPSSLHSEPPCQGSGTVGGPSPGTSGPLHPFPEPEHGMRSPEAPASGTLSPPDVRATNISPPGGQHPPWSNASAQARPGKSESADGDERESPVANICRVSIMCLEKGPPVTAEFRGCMSTRLQEAVR